MDIPLQPQREIDRLTANDFTVIAKALRGALQSAARDPVLPSLSIFGLLRAQLRSAIDLAERRAQEFRAQAADAHNYPQNPIVELAQALGSRPVDHHDDARESN